MALTKASLVRVRLGAATVVFGCASMCAQMPIGSVSTLEATVTGASSTSNDRAQLGTNGTVTAKDRPAFVQLLRGGTVKVCATSGVHLTAGTPAAASSDAPAGTPGASGLAASGVVVTDTTSPAAAPSTLDATKVSVAAWSANIPPPLMVALDRGALELRMGTVPGDIVMTPDLRFSFSGEGLLDVRIRVTRNGDTCVDNRVAGLAGHPELQVGSLFGSETYNVRSGQHVLFEGGNLREVVDNETSPCGCPEEPARVPEAQVELQARKSAKITGTQAAVQHPFPADVSQGLAPPPAVPQAAPQVTHTQVATTLVFNGGAAAEAPAKSVNAAKPAFEEKKGFFRSIGRFFKRVF